MTTVFADTFYFLALLSEKDRSHDQAFAWTNAFVGTILTTDWILAEVADALAGSSTRTRCAQFLQALRKNALFRIVRANGAQFDRGMELYALRRDKEWSLTDCVSFVVMKERRLRDALTADRHFEQAGFRALLK